MEHTVVYECAICAAVSPALVTELADPKTFVSERTQKAFRDLEDAKRLVGRPADADPMATLSNEMLDASAKRTLVYATCPRCGKRNPAGVAAQAASERQTRIIGTLASAGAAGGIWLLPSLALVVAVIVMTVTILVLGARTGQLRWTSVVWNVGLAALFVAAAWLYPRASSLLPLILAVRFAVYREKSDHAWTTAQASIRFETPYR